VIVSFDSPVGVVEAMRMPAIVVAVMVVHSDGSRLAIAGGLCPATMFGRIDRERSQQHQQHGGYCDLPVCSRFSEHRSYV
jgi:hypothetical protein